MPVHFQFINCWTQCATGWIYSREIGVEARDQLPIILIHGLGVSGTYFLPLARELAPRVKIFIPDLPGTGRSDKPANVLDVAGLSDALLEWMDARTITPSILVGHSLGCQVAVDLAMRYPQRVSRLLLVSPTFDPAAASPYLQLLRLVRDSLREPPSLVLLAISDYLRAGPLRVMRTLHLTMQDRIEAKLPTIEIETCVMTGSLDPIAPPSWAKTLAAVAPRGSFISVTGAAHAVNYSHAHAIARVLLSPANAPASCSVD